LGNQLFSFFSVLLNVGKPDNLGIASMLQARKVHLSLPPIAYLWKAGDESIPFFFAAYAALRANVTVL
jgi:hypothetical protein